MLPIAIQLYTVRDQAAADFEGTLRAIKAMGYEGVEFAGLHGKTAAEVAGIAVNEKTAPTDTDLSATVTIAIGGFQALIAKAAQ